jgi:hypothetical protein
VAFIASDGWRGEELTSGAISSWFSLYLEKPVAPVSYSLIPAAIGLTALLEAWTVWSVRRRSRETASGDDGSPDSDALRKGSPAQEQTGLSNAEESDISNDDV